MTGRIALAGGAALAVAMGIGRFAFTPILPMMQEGAGLTLAQGAWLASANYLGYLAGALSAVGLRLRPASAIRAGLVLVAASTLAMAWGESLLPWLAWRAVAGVASAWLLVFVSAWALERLAAAGQPQLGGVVFAGVGAGIVLAGVVCLVLMRIGGDHADAWLVLGIAALAATALLWPVLQSGESAAMPAPPPHFSKRWSTDYLRLVLGYGAFGLGYIIPATFLPVMAKQAIAGTDLFGWAWPLFGASALASTLMAAHVLRAHSYRRMLVAAMLVMAAGVALPLALPGIAGIALASLCVGGTFMVATMAGMQEARRIGGHGAKDLGAAMTAAFAAGQVAGPLLAAALSGLSHGFAIALAVAAAILCAGAAALAVRTEEECHA